MKRLIALALLALGCSGPTISHNCTSEVCGGSSSKTWQLCTDVTAGGVETITYNYGGMSCSYQSTQSSSDCDAKKNSYCTAP
jgi:hypothetical protein